MHSFDIDIAGKQIPVTPTLALINELEDRFSILPDLLKQMQDRALPLKTQIAVITRTAAQNGVELNDVDFEQQLAAQGATGISRECIKILSVLTAGVEALQHFTGSGDGLGKPKPKA
ncbi:MAG: hypothetical protein ACQEQL_08890 [Pseudomonadota bacterium]